MPYQSAKRAPRSCTECTRRKIRCERQYPCAACVKRGQPDKCVRPTTTMAEPDHDPVQVLPSQLRDLNRQADSPEDLLVALESLSHVQSSTHRDNVAPTDIDQLYQPARPVVLMFLPERRSSEIIIEFALAHLTWIHCAIRAPVFWEEHRCFWDALARGDTAVTEDHGWLSIYLSLLTAGLVFMEPEQRPQLDRLRGIGASRSHPTSTADPAASVMRMWYDAALHELEASRPFSGPSIRTVQTVAILTLVHHYFEETEREYMLLGLAINTARCLNMHLLGRESDYPPRLRDQSVWATVQDRQMGRRLWWTLVICDWLGRFSNPSSISSLSFNTRLEPCPEDTDLYLPTGTPTAPDARSPVWHHITMSRLAGIIYVHIKEPRKPDVAKLSRCINHVEEILLQTSSAQQPMLAGTNTPWMAHQDYLLVYTIQFLRVTIARAVLVLWLKGSPGFDLAEGMRVINKGVEAASAILTHRMKPVPGYFLHSWVVFTSTLSAGIFLAVHLMCFKSTLSADQIEAQRDLIRTCATLVALPQHHPQSQSNKGSTLLHRLLGAEAMQYPGVLVEKSQLMELLRSAVSVNEVKQHPPAHMNPNPAAMEADIDMTMRAGIMSGSTLGATIPQIDDGLAQTQVDEMWQALMEEWFPPSPATIPGLDVYYT